MNDGELAFPVRRAEEIAACIMSLAGGNRTDTWAISADAISASIGAVTACDISELLVTAASCSFKQLILVAK